MITNLNLKLIVENNTIILLDICNSNIDILLWCFICLNIKIILENEINNNINIRYKVKENIIKILYILNILLIIIALLYIITFIHIIIYYILYIFGYYININELDLSIYKYIHNILYFLYFTILVHIIINYIKDGYKISKNIYIKYITYIILLLSIYKIINYIIILL